MGFIYPVQLFHQILGLAGDDSLFSVFHCQNCPHLLCYVSFSDTPNRKVSVHSDSSDFDSEPHKRRNQILSVLFAFGAMLGYAILTGIVSIEHVRQQGALEGPSHGDEEEEEEEEED